MSVAAQSRPRPRVDPIQTDGALGTSREYPDSDSPVWTGISSRATPLHPEVRYTGKAHDQRVVGRLDVSHRHKSTGDISASAIENGRRATAAHISTPTADTARLKPSPLANSPRPPPWAKTRRMSLDKTGVKSPMSPRQRAKWFQSQLRGPVHPSAAATPTTAVRSPIVPPRESLWNRGAQFLREAATADVYVMPVELRKSGGNATSPAVISPLPEDGHITIRLVVHSQSRGDIGMTRSFDLEALRSTIADPVSPKSPLLSAPSSTVALPSVGEFISATTAGRGLPRLMLPAVPMHLLFARVQLPVLASILMSDQVQQGDTIELPLPCPRAWSETVAFVYTGQGEVTRDVFWNILYLGGKV